MEIREVTIKDINRVMEIISDAKRLLSKNSLQWQQEYPSVATMTNDINSHHLYGAFDNELLVGFLALIIGKDESYEKIYEGNWFKKASKDDLVIHRIAVKEEYHGKHIGDMMIKFAIKYAKEKGCVSIKADTHKVNKPMQYLLTSNDFSYQGVIYLLHEKIDNERVAFERLVE